MTGAERKRQVVFKGGRKNASSKGKGTSLDGVRRCETAILGDAGGRGELAQVASVIGS